MTLVSLLGKWMVHQTPFNHRPHQCHGCSCKNRCPEHTVTIDFSRGSPMPENDFNDSFEGYKVECLSYINDALWQCLSFLKTRHLIIKQRPFCVCLGRKAEGAGNWEKTQWSSEWWVSFCLFFFLDNFSFYCFVDSRCYKYRMRNLPRPIGMLRALAHRMPGILVQPLPWDSSVTTCITCYSNIYLLDDGRRRLQLAFCLLSVGGIWWECGIWACNWRRRRMFCFTNDMYVWMPSMNLRRL